MIVYVHEEFLLLAAGAGEHSLVWKVSQSTRVTEIFIAPGNAGTSQIGTNISASSVDEIVNWLRSNSVDLAIVGPDSYLAEGIVDAIQEINIPVFGPTKAASEIEWSKAFAKDFMKREGIPTASYEAFTDIDKAKEYAAGGKFPLVIKASGLASGKGVIIAENVSEADSALDTIMAEGKFGNAGSEVIIEEYLEGIEISTHAFCDGDTAVMFPASQDHKRIFDGDKGPNTGGMGTVAPVPGITDDHIEEIRQKIVVPVLQGLKKLGRPFKGILFPGIMLTEEGPKVIEFNARFGDPETQSYMRLLESDLLDVLLACINGTLSDANVTWSTLSACCVILASGGYPDEYQKGQMISGLEKALHDDGIEIFHAGTARNNAGDIVTNGGRVLGVSATGNTLDESLANAYRAVKMISFEGMQYRKDIGGKLQPLNHQ